MAPWNAEELDDLLETHHVPTNNTETIRQSIRVPSCECKECTTTTEVQEVYAKEKFNDYHKISPNNSGELSAHRYMIMASHMFAFSLKDRSYGKFTCEVVCFIFANEQTCWLWMGLKSL